MIIQSMSPRSSHLQSDWKINMNVYLVLVIHPSLETYHKYCRHQEDLFMLLQLVTLTTVKRKENVNVLDRNL